MLATLWLPILAKAVSTALLVVCASALAEALGPFWGALVASLPVSAGPAYLFLAMQHDADFVAASALSSFAANAATGMFLIVYAKLARKTPPWPPSASRWRHGSRPASPQVTSPGRQTSALLLNLAVYGAGFRLLRGIHKAKFQSATHARRKWFDLPLRATAIALFVSAVVLTSSVLGAAATGIAAVFPISLTSLIIILRPRIGAAASALLAATALQAMLGFGLMLLALHLAIRPWGTATALLVALLVSLAWSAGLLALRRRRKPTPQPAPSNPE